MGEIKKEFRYLTIPQYEQEQDYLRTMHKSGWKLTRINSFGVYYFVKCVPEEVVYQVDYNPEGLANKAEYVQMFLDCGWEYLFDYEGYSYFRKPISKMQGEGEEHIFCDDASKLDMMGRVYKNRIKPLIIFLFILIIPQFINNTVGYGNRSIVQKGLAIAYLVLLILSLSTIVSFTVQYYRCKNKVKE